MARKHEKRKEINSRFNTKTPNNSKLTVVYLQLTTVFTVVGHSGLVSDLLHIWCKNSTAMTPYYHS